MVFSSPDFFVPFFTRGTFIVSNAFFFMQLAFFAYFRHFVSICITSYANPVTQVIY